MMEAKLLCLESTEPIAAGRPRQWTIVNGTGVLISPGQTPQAPPPLFTEDVLRRQIIEYMTYKLGDLDFPSTRSGWTKWFVGTLAETNGSTVNQVWQATPPYWNNHKWEGQCHYHEE